MITAFMAYTTAMAVPLALAARVLEACAGLKGSPRRWGWAGALVLLVVLTMSTPWRVAPPSSGGISAEVAAASTGNHASAFTWAFMLNDVRWRASVTLSGLARFDAVAGGLWLIASAAVLMFYAGGQRALRRRRRHWRPEVIHGYAVMVAPDAGPAVVGAWSPRIVIPQWALALDAHHLELLLRHEGEHQRAHDARLLHGCALALILMPWNPMVWWMVARLRLAVELDCDARVLGAASAGDRETYGDLLLLVAGKSPVRAAYAAPALFERISSLNRRIAAMYATPARHVRARVLSASALGAALIFAALAVPVPALHAQTAATQGPYDVKTPGLVAPTPVHSVNPRYTPEALQQKVQGLVTIEAVAESDGSLSHPLIIKSLDQKYGLDDEAIKAARQWTFEPGRLNGKAVPVRVTLEFRFVVRERS